MRSVVLGKSGLEVSAVGFGGIPIQRVSEAEAARAIHRAMDLGVTFIDTAAGYGDSQKKIGRAIAGRRDGLVLATKSGNKTRSGVLADIERARREMQTDVIDLFQFHGLSSREALDKTLAAGGAMDGALEARDRGWVAHIGVTSHSLDLSLELVEQPQFETIQFPFNLVTNEPADELIPKARDLGVGFIVMKPMCGGQFDDAELAFEFLNAYPDLVAIPGIERAEEIEQIASIVASGATLTGEDKARADAIAARLGKLFCRRCGYCMPCPNDVPIQLGMVYDSLAKRLPDGRVASLAANLAEKLGQCADCAACEEKCPYDLPIREVVRRNREAAEAWLREHGL